MIDILGHIAYLNLALGTFFVYWRDKNGHLGRLLGNTLFLFIGFYTGYSSIIIWSLILMWMDYKAYRGWHE